MIQHLFFVAILGQSTTVPWPDRNISVELTIGSSSSVLREAFDHSGIKVRVVGTIGEEIIAIDCDNLPVQEVAERVANGLSAEWKFSGNTFILARSKKQQDKLEADFTKLIDTQISKSLAQYADWLRGMPTPYDRAQSLVAAFRQDRLNLNKELNQIQPQPILLRQLLVAISSPTISSLPLDSAVVFSDNPTIFQIALPSRCNAGIKEYHEAERVLSTVITEGGAIPGLESWFKAVYDSASEQSPGKSILILRRTLGSLWATLGTYSASGKLRGASALVIPFEDSKTAVRSLPAVGTISAPIDFLEWVSVCNGSTATATNKKFPRELLSPDSFDPLDISTRALIESATGGLKSKGAFGVLDDRLVGFAFQSLVENRLNTDTFWNLIHQRGVAKADYDGKWLTIQPLDRFATEKRRLFRASLKRYVTAILDGKSYSIREAGLLRANSGYHALREPLFRAFLRAFEAEQAYESVKGMSDAALELIGRISELQWNDLQNGKVIKFQQLAPLSQMSLANWINTTIRACERPPNTESKIPDQNLTGSELKTHDQLENIRLGLDESTCSLFKMSTCPPAFEAFFPFVPMDQSWLMVRIQEMLDGKAIIAASDLDAVEGQIGVSTDNFLTATLPSGAFASARFQGKPIWQAEKVKLSTLVKK